MGILNYTTQIATEKTISEIEKILSEHGAKKILKEYYGDGTVDSISFMIEWDEKMIPIRLPMNIQAVMKVINNQTEERKKGKSVVPRRYFNDMDQAKRVGWRIIKNWVEAQMALHELKMVKIQEIFLPYVIGIDGKTLYEHIEEKKFSGFLLDKQ